MIRNYYTEAFKNGVVPVVSATQLIDGTVKITDSTTATGVVNAITSTTFILGAVNGAIQVGMYLTAPASGAAAAITINDQVMVAAVVHGAAATTVTLNKPRQTAAGQNLTFFNVNQNSWREYSLFIGTQPSQGLISETANAAAAAQAIVTWKVSNPYIQVGMNVYDDGVLIGVVGTVTTANQISLVANLAALIANDSVLTFAFSVLPSISVLTIDNKTVTFTNPAQGFVLPVSVVQVTAVAGGLSNLIALD
jgi:hypothetical protein